MKVHVRYYSHGESALITVSKRLTTSASYHFRSVDDKKDLQPPYVKAIFGLEGVVDVAVEQYSVCIWKPTLFEWENIIPYAIQAIAAEVAQDEIIEELPATDERQQKMNRD